MRTSRLEIALLTTTIWNVQDLVGLDSAIAAIMGCQGGRVDWRIRAVDNFPVCISIKVYILAPRCTFCDVSIMDWEAGSGVARPSTLADRAC
jgi:hypothetical protein